MKISFNLVLRIVAAVNIIQKNEINLCKVNDEIDYEKLNDKTLEILHHFMFANDTAVSSVSVNSQAEEVDQNVSREESQSASQLVSIDSMVLEFSKNWFDMLVELNPLINVLEKSIERNEIVTNQLYGHTTQNEWLATDGSYIRIPLQSSIEGQRSSLLISKDLLKSFNRFMFENDIGISSYNADTQVKEKNQHDEHDVMDTLAYLFSQNWIGSSKLNSTTHVPEDCNRITELHLDDSTSHEDLPNSSYDADVS